MGKSSQKNYTRPTAEYQKRYLSTISGEEAIDLRRGERYLYFMRIKKQMAVLAALALAVIVSARGLDKPGQPEVIAVRGLAQPVEIIRDKWGIAHIYAKNQNDLFFAQGFNVASDRLFQLEIWRRQATGTVAEILGLKALRRDIGARLLRFRGDIRKELSYYHPQGAEIVGAFVRGINAYIDLTQKNPGVLPVEFRLLGLTPGYWTPEIVVSRHNGLFRNASAEVTLARAVQAVGAEKLEDLLDLHPGNPELKPAEGIDVGSISDKILALYREARAPVRFGPEDLKTTISITPKGPMPLHWLHSSDSRGDVSETEGSNNWAVSGRLSRSGAPLLANDPHRDLQIPSLRYWVHLQAPGWNVIGAGEPALPGVSIGHNEDGAWGVTIFAADQEDIYIYDTNSRNRNQYLYQGRWENMRISRERILVKGKRPYKATLKFTRHGPVIFEDEERRKVYALRAAWLETGCAPYLASLQADQARTWQDFRRAIFNNRTPSLNFVWADRSGDIGWQTTGLVPVRKNWPGLLPVPGDGRFEWLGFIPPPELPSLHNPPSGFVATANEDNLPAGYAHEVGYIWTDLFRFLRISEVLGSKSMMDVSDMTALQQDFFSIPARRLAPLLENLWSEDELVRKCLDVLKSWDFVLSPDSSAAAIFMSWQRALLDNLDARLYPPDFRGSLPGKSLAKMIGWLRAADGRLGLDSEASRDRLVLESLEQAALFLKKTFGPDIKQWRYGDEKFHHVFLRHPLSEAASAGVRRTFDLGPLPRGGNGQTVNNTSDSDNQASGATFRIVVDLADWDLALGTNSPGQAGNPESLHYSDLFVLWAEGRYFPIYFSRGKILAAAERTICLEPAKGQRL
jgi:penicillin amidase